MPDALVFVVPVLVGLALVVVAVRRPAVVTVSDETRLPAPPDDVERFSFGPLGSITGSQMTQAGPGQVTLTSSWIPSWAVVVAILAFPVGLVVPLLVRQRLTLQVRYRDAAGGTLVQVSGKARRRVALEVGRALESVPV